MTAPRMMSGDGWAVYVQDDRYAVAKRTTAGPAAWAVFTHLPIHGWTVMPADDHLTEAQARRKFSARSSVVADPFMRIVPADYSRAASEPVPA